MSKLPGYDSTVICPYNKCHVILKSRIQTHLIKCGRQHPEIKLETCPFDMTHKFRAEEKDVRFFNSNFGLLFLKLKIFWFKQKHIEECPSRENFDRYVYSIGTSKPGTSSQSQSNSQPPPRHYDDDEDWKWIMEQ